MDCLGLINSFSFDPLFYSSVSFFIDYSINSYPGQNIQRLPFTDDLTYPSSPQPLPVPVAPAATGEQYRKVDARTDYLSAPGLIAPIPQLPLIPSPITTKDASMTANLMNTQSLTGPQLNAPVFDFPIQQRPQPPPNPNAVRVSEYI